MDHDAPAIPFLFNCVQKVTGRAFHPKQRRMHSPPAGSAAHEFLHAMVAGIRDVEIAAWPVSGSGLDAI
jgi:hypothetical protein